MNKRTLLTASLALCLLPALAGTVKLPAEKSVVSADIPDTWQPAPDGDGILAESPDKVATIYLEVVTTEKEMSLAVQDGLNWLTKDHGLEVNAATKTVKDLEIAGRKWNRISWDAESKEWGPAVVGFLLTEVRGKVLTITFWISKKDSEKSLEALGKIFESVKTL